MSFLFKKRNQNTKNDCDIRQTQSTPSAITKKLQYKLKWGVPRGFTLRLCNQKVDICQNKTVSFFGGGSCFDATKKRLSEPSLFFTKTTFLSKESTNMTQRSGTSQKEMIFYDSKTGIPLFQMKRRWVDFINESRSNGYLTFHEDDVIIENIMITNNNDVFSKDGHTYLGHTKRYTEETETKHKDTQADTTSNDARFFINIVSIAGYPTHYNENLLLDTTTNVRSWKEQLSFSEYNNSRSTRENNDDEDSHMTFRDDEDSFDDFDDRSINM